jgi:CheY-like chemotaxis protein
MGNASELRRVFTNLIINAVEAMPQGGMLRVATEQQGDRGLVHIKDTGVGMTEEHQSQLFEPFFTTKSGTGSGLGLAISQRTVQRHGGEILVRSTPGVGSEFVVVLPTIDKPAVKEPVLDEPSAGQEPEPSPDEEESSASLNVLVVDDERSVRSLLERLLGRVGHCVWSVASGREALELLNERSFDLLITDLGMPDMSGQELAQKAHDASPEMPVILSTGWGESITPSQLEEMGVTALLSKPFTHQDLVAALDQARGDRSSHGSEGE